MAIIIQAAAFIGSLVVAGLVFNIVNFLTLHFHRLAQPLARYKRRGKPTYALVTGTSAGIGLGIAQALVRGGFNVIILGHLEGELAQAAAGLRKLRTDAVVNILVTDTQNQGGHGQDER